MDARRLGLRHARVLLDPHRDRCGAAALPPVRHRPDHQPHPQLRSAHRAARRRLHRRGSWVSASCWDGTRAWSWRSPRWRSRRCSSRPAGGSRRRWIVASTDAATTPPRRSRRSAPGCARRSIWTPCRPSWSRSSIRRCNRPGSRYGFGREPEAAEPLEHDRWSAAVWLQPAPATLSRLLHRPARP
jgi:hypothetical protein